MISTHARFDWKALSWQDGVGRHSRLFIYLCMYFDKNGQNYTLAHTKYAGAAYRKACISLYQHHTACVSLSVASFAPYSFSLALPCLLQFISAQAWGCLTWLRMLFSKRIDTSEEDEAFLYSHNQIAKPGLILSFIKWCIFSTPLYSLKSHPLHLPSSFILFLFAAVYFHCSPFNPLSVFHLESFRHKKKMRIKYCPTDTDATKLQEYFSLPF